MANNIAVAVSVDTSSLIANRAIMSAELKAMQKDLNDTAKVARTTGLTDEMRTSMLASADGVARLTGQLALNKTQMQAASVAQTESAAATSAETVAVEVNTRAHVSNRAAREGLVLVHEALSGNYRRMAGSAMIEAQALMSGGTAASVAAAAFSPLGIAVIALTAGMGFLAYKEYEAEQASSRMTEAFALTGRGATNSAEAVRAETDALDGMSGVSSKAAEALVEFDAAHAEVNARISEAANQIAPQFIQAFGKDGPEALNKLKSSLADIENSTLTQAIGKFNELNSTMLGLKPAEVEMIEGMIQAGDRIGAVNRILADLAAQGGGHIDSLNQQIVATQAELTKAKANAAELLQEVEHPIDPEAIMGITMAAAQADSRVQQLQGRLRQLQGESAASPDHGETYEAAFAQSHATLDSLRDSASRAKDAVAELHREMAQRRAVNPNDKEVTDYYAHQAKVDHDLEHRDDPGDFKKPKVHKEAGESPMTGMENALKQSEFNIRQSTGAWQTDMSSMEAKYWKDKLDKAKEGSKLYGEIQARYQDALLRSGGRSAQQQRQMSMSDSETTLSVTKDQDKDKSQAASSGFEQRLAGIKKDPNSSVGVSADDKYAAMVTAAQADAAAELKAQEDKKAAYADDVAAVHEAANQETVINQNLQSTLAGLESQRTADVQRENQARTQAEKEAARQKEEAWRETNQVVYNAENQLISGIISDRKTMGQMLMSIGSEIVQREIQDDLRALTAKKLAALEGTQVDAKEAQGGLLMHLLSKQREVATTVGSEAAKTAAVAAGGEARVAATASASTQAAVITSTHNIKEITSHAATAAAGAYHAMAAIPVVGPILGAAAAAVTFAAVEGYGVLASFDKGTNSLPNDMIAQIHAGERIVPAADNSKLMAAVDRGTGGGGGGPMGDMHVHYSPTVNGQMPFAEQLQQHEGNILSMMQRMHRDDKLKFLRK
jgi:hypothetical protein